MLRRAHKIASMVPPLSVVYAVTLEVSAPIDHAVRSRQAEALLLCPVEGYAARFRRHR